MKTPKEDPDDKRDRERARRAAELERRKAAQGSARGLTADLGSVYGFSGLPGFGQVGSGGVPVTSGLGAQLSGMFR